MNVILSALICAVSLQAADESTCSIYENGLQLFAAGRYASAVHCLKEVVAQQECPQAKYHLAMAQLGCRKFRDGFTTLHDYLCGQNSLPKQWKGEDLTDKKILVRVSCANPADILIFMRFIGAIKQTTAQVFVCVPEAFMDFFQSQGITCCPDGACADDCTKNECDYEVYLSSIPVIMQAAMEDMRQKAYIKADDVRSEHHRQAMATDKMKVGVLVRNPEVPVSMLNDLTAKCDYYCLLSLQKMDSFAPQPVTKDCMCKDYLPELCAIMQNLDVVITDDAIVGDMAGAMGIKCCMIVDKPDWRYPKNKTESVWHESMRIFRKTRRYSYRILLQRILDHVCPVAVEHLEA
jgi:hypothetical protein